MAGHKLVRRLAVTMLAPALGEHVFFARLQHREPADFVEVSSKSLVCGDDGESRNTGHDGALPILCASAVGKRFVYPKRGEQVLISIKPWQTALTNYCFRRITG
jgi:hypothetical protein